MIAVVRVVPHTVQYGQSPFDIDIRVNTGCTRSVVSADWAALCGVLEAPGLYHIVEDTDPGHSQELDCTRLVTFDVEYEGKSSVVAAWVSPSIQREVLLGSQTLTELGLVVANPTSNDEVVGKIFPEPGPVHGGVGDEDLGKLPIGVLAERPVVPISSRVRPPVYYDPFVQPKKKVGWSHDLEDVQVLDKNDNPVVPTAVIDKVATHGGAGGEPVLGLQGTLPQGYVYNKVNDPSISMAQFRKNNKEIADGGQSIIWTDDDSSVQSVSSMLSSDGDRHSGCRRGEPCPDNPSGDLLDVAQELFPEDQNSEVESSDFSASLLSGGSGDDHSETDDGVVVVEDLMQA